MSTLERKIAWIDFIDDFYEESQQYKKCKSNHTKFLYWFTLLSYIQL